jgi:hypothetical protein
MKKEPYRVQGDAKQGLRIAVPTETGVKKGDRYDCTFVPNRESGIFLPAGSLVYVPHNVDDNAGTGGSGRESTKKVRK